MVLHGILVKAVTTVATGAVGVAAYEALRKVVAKLTIREASVTAAEWGLRGTRKAAEISARRAANQFDTNLDERPQLDAVGN
jgi:hypothetical protein